MTTVKIRTSEKVFKTVMEKMLWLGYSDFAAFVDDAVRSRAIQLLVTAKNQNGEMTE